MLPVAFETEFLEIQGCSLNAACLASFSSLSILHRIRWSHPQFSHSVMSDCLQPRVLQHTKPPCPSPTPGAYSNSCPWSRWCYPTISSSVVPFPSCLQSFPASGSFPMSQLFASGGLSIAFPSALFYPATPPVAMVNLPSRIPNPDSILPSFGPLIWPLCPLQPSLSNPDLVPLLSLRDSQEAQW